MPGPVEMLFILCGFGSIFVTHKIIRLCGALRAYKRDALRDEGYTVEDLQISTLDAKHMKKDQAVSMAHLNLIGLTMIGLLCYAMTIWIVGAWAGWLPPGPVASPVRPQPQ